MHSHASRFHSGAQFAPYQDLTFNHFTDMPQHEYVAHQGNSPFSWARRSAALAERSREHDAAVHRAQQEQFAEMVRRMQAMEGRLEAIASSIASFPPPAAPQRWAEDGWGGRGDRGWGGERAAAAAGPSDVMLLVLIMLVALVLVTLAVRPSSPPHFANAPAPTVLVMPAGAGAGEGQRFIVPPRSDHGFGS